MADKEHNNGAKKVTESQVTQAQKRPSTSLLKDICPKLLISTKSYEGLTSQPPDHIPKTTTASALITTSSAANQYQTAQAALRKSGATPDFTVSKKS